METLENYTDHDFQAYYTDAQEIQKLMIQLLGNVSGKYILEPCAGEGAFISSLSGIPTRVDAIDIDQKHVKFIKENFPSFVKATKVDFIDEFLEAGLFSSQTIGSEYDGIICNPPYGLNFSIDYRKKLKKRFSNLYVRESYGLFMHFGIDALREGGRYVFIVPDTFLTSTNHKPLRQFLSESGTLSEIVQFKSKRFESVNFGYGNLCIIAGYKGKQNEIHKARWLDAISSDGAISLEEVNRSSIVPHSYFKEAMKDGWYHPSVRTRLVFKTENVLLGDIAECRTGIYTGDNKRFCAFDESRAPARANGHGIDWEKKVHLEPLSSLQKSQGLTGSKNYVPFIRGGHRQPFDKTAHALDWNSEAVSYYANDKKARLQNSKFYFRDGLAIPMVTSGRISASLMSKAIFDQGVVGLFPNDDRDLDFLLLYLNSRFVSEVVKPAINPGANNSANYIKKIPVPKLSNLLREQASVLVNRAKKVGWKTTEAECEAFISNVVGF